MLRYSEIVKLLFPVILTAMAMFGQQQQGQGVNLYTREKEAALGAGLAKEIRRTVTLVDSDSVRDYIERLSSRLLAQFPDTGLKYEIAVIFDPGGTMNEPTSLPGGYIFVFAGLFRAAQSEGEFAGMLAHAIAHVAERHSTRMAARGQMMNLASIPLIFIGGWSGWRGDANLVPIGFLALARDNELAADHLAVQAIAGAGYDPSNLLNYVSRLQPQLTGELKQRFSGLPPLDTRISNLRDAIDALPPRVYASGDEFSLVQQEVRRMAPPPEPQAPTLRRKNER